MMIITRGSIIIAILHITMSTTIDNNIYCANEKSIAKLFDYNVINVMEGVQFKRKFTTLRNNRDDNGTHLESSAKT